MRRQFQMGSVVVGLGLAGCGSESPSSKGRSTGRVADLVDSGPEVCTEVLETDASGCLVVEETDAEARGRWPDILRRQYGAGGEELTRDVRGGEQPDTERFCSLEWGGARLLSEECAGVSVYRYAYEYDGSGHIVASTYDAGADGELDKSWAYLTDADGRVLEASVDDDMDGVPDAAQTFAWDADGNLTEETWDYTLDGLVDYRLTLAWSGGLLVSEQVDTDGDGVVDEEEVWTYDELGRPTEALLYKNGNGTAAETTRWTYVLCVLDKKVVTDAGGNRVEYLYTHDDLGRQTLEVEDWEGDGTPDRIKATEWICPGEHR